MLFLSLGEQEIKIAIGTFVFMVLLSEFAFLVNFAPPCGCQGSQSFLVGVKGRYSQVSIKRAVYIKRAGRSIFKK